MMKTPKELKSLIAHLKMLPGVGKKTAERFAYHLLESPTQEIQQFSALLRTLQENVIFCEICGVMLYEKECFSCKESNRNPHILLVVAKPKEVITIEESISYKGRYHVLGQLLSPLDDIGPADLNTQKLILRLSYEPVEEIILAFDSTLEGDATALYLHDHLKKFPIKITRPALGLPMGSSFDFVDEGTIMRSITARLPI
ncbi:MAG: recombination mediator RecR [Simkaniaceae bacterium]